MERGGYVYMVSNRTRTVIYTGETSNLYARVTEHKQGTGSIFTSRYKCTDLIYYEPFSDIESAIAREKQIKKWKREYKENVINAFNPTWADLTDSVMDFD